MPRPIWEVTPEQLAFSADIRARDAALQAWLGERGSYHPEEVPEALLPLVTNEQRSHAEVIEFLSRPLAYGVTYYAYLSSDANDVTTWPGNKLAEVTKITRNKLRHCAGLASERGGFWANGIDGRVYHGRHNGPGMHCTLRLAKHQPKEKSESPNASREEQNARLIDCGPNNWDDNDSED